MFEIAPVVTVAGRERVPDFRTRVPESDWTYIEVARPDALKAEERVKQVLQQLIRTVKEIKKSFTLEVFLRRQPTDHEVIAIARRIPDFCELEGAQEEDMGAVGLLLLNHAQPGQRREARQLPKESSGLLMLEHVEFSCGPPPSFLRLMASNGKPSASCS